MTFYFLLLTCVLGVWTDESERKFKDSHRARSPSPQRRPLNIPLPPKRFPVVPKVNPALIDPMAGHNDFMKELKRRRNILDPGKPLRAKPVQPALPAGEADRLMEEALRVINIPSEFKKRAKVLEEAVKRRDDQVLLKTPTKPVKKTTYVVENPRGLQVERPRVVTPAADEKPLKRQGWMKTNPVDFKVQTFLDSAVESPSIPPNLITPADEKRPQRKGWKKPDTVDFKVQTLPESAVEARK